MAVLDAFEVAVRGLSANWQAAAEVAGRLAGSRRYEAQARPLRYSMSLCAPSGLISAVVALRRALLESEAQTGESQSQDQERH